MTWLFIFQAHGATAAMGLVRHLKKCHHLIPDTQDSSLRSHDSRLRLLRKNSVGRPTDTWALYTLCKRWLTAGTKKARQSTVGRAHVLQNTLQMLRQHDRMDRSGSSYKVFQKVCAFREAATSHQRKRNYCSLVCVRPTGDGRST